MADIHGSSTIDLEGGGVQPYHLLKPSPWPLVVSLAAGLMVGGAAWWMYLHRTDVADYQTLAKSIFFLGLAGVIFVMFGWWRDVIREAVVEKAHTPVVKIGLRYGMSLFIASEVMFFVAFFWAYFDAAWFPAEAIQFLRLEHTGGHWPPTGIVTFNPFDLPLMMTVMLLLSGTTVTWAHHAMIEGHMTEARNALICTVAIAAMFLGFQVYEYSHATFAFGGTDGSIFGSTFYMATGFHGFHVFIGTVFLFVCLIRTIMMHFTAKSHFGFEAAAWYWHFVDVVWLFLFIAIYWGSRAGAVAH